MHTGQGSCLWSEKWQVVEVTSNSGRGSFVLICQCCMVCLVWHGNDVLSCGMAVKKVIALICSVNQHVF